MLPPRPLSVIPTDELVLLDVANEPHTAHPITPYRVLLSYLLMKVGFSMSSYQEIMAEQERQRRSAEAAAARRAEARSEEQLKAIQSIAEAAQRRADIAMQEAASAQARAVSAKKESRRSFIISVISVVISVLGIHGSLLIR